MIAVDAFSSQLMTSGHRPPPQAPRLAGASRTDASSLPARSAVAVARLTALLAATSGSRWCRRVQYLCHRGFSNRPDHADLYAVGVRWPNLGYAGASSIGCVHAGVLRNTPPVIRSPSCD